MENILFYRLLGAFFLTIATMMASLAALYYKSPRIRIFQMPVHVFFVILCLSLGVGFLFFPFYLTSQLNSSATCALKFFAFTAMAGFFFQQGLDWYLWRPWDRNVSREEKELRIYAPYTREEIKLREELRYVLLSFFLSVLVLLGLLITDTLHTNTRRMAIPYIPYIFGPCMISFLILMAFAEHWKGKLPSTYEGFHERNLLLGVFSKRPIADVTAQQHNLFKLLSNSAPSTRKAFWYSKCFAYAASLAAAAFPVAAGWETLPSRLSWLFFFAAFLIIAQEVMSIGKLFRQRSEWEEVK